MSKFTDSLPDNEQPATLRLFVRPSPKGGYTVALMEHDKPASGGGGVFRTSRRVE